jgi:hypothetical protein
VVRPCERTEVGRRFPPIRGTTRAPGVGPGLNKARTADCPPPLCRVRNRRPRAVEGRDTGPLRPQRASIGRNSLPVSRGSVSARTAGGENPRSHAPMSTESARTSPCGLTRSMTSPKEGCSAIKARRFPFDIPARRLPRLAAASHKSGDVSPVFWPFLSGPEGIPSLGRLCSAGPRSTVLSHHLRMKELRNEGEAPHPWFAHQSPPSDQRLTRHLTRAGRSTAGRYTLYGGVLASSASFASASASS